MLIALVIIPYLLLAIAGYYFYKRKSSITTYYVTVKLNGGSKSKLVLKEEQYEQFKTWLNQAEGIYDIGDGINTITLNRRYVACVEVKKR